MAESRKKDKFGKTPEWKDAIRPRPVSKADEQVLKVVLFEEMDEDKIRHFEDIYGPSTYVNIH